MNYGGAWNSPVTVDLDAAAITAINNSIAGSGQFVIGGTLTPAAAPDATATAGLLALGLAAMFAAARFQRREA